MTAGEGNQTRISRSQASTRNHLTIPDSLVINSIYCLYHNGLFHKEQYWLDLLSKQHRTLANKPLSQYCPSHPVWHTHFLLGSSHLTLLTLQGSYLQNTYIFWEQSAPVYIVSQWQMTPGPTISWHVPCPEQLSESHSSASGWKKWPSVKDIL